MKVASTALLAALLVAPAMAQTAPSATPTAAAAPAQPGATAESRREATTLAKATGVDAQVNAVFHLLHDQLVQILATSSRKSPSDVTPIVDQVLMPEMQAQAPALTAAIIEIWAANFTAEELQQLRAFYGTPLGTKLLQKQPVITQQAIAAGQSWGKQVAQEALAHNADELRRRGLTL